MIAIKSWFLKIWLILIVTGIAGCGNQATTAPRQPTAPSTANEAVAETVDVESLPMSVNAAIVQDIRQRDDVIVLDVRQDWEYQAGHIPHANLIPLDQLPQRLDEIPADKTIIAVCQSGSRSGQATQYLRQHGFEKVHNMTGGMLAWEQAGYEIE